MEGAPLYNMFNGDCTDPATTRAKRRIGRIAKLCTQLVGSFESRLCNGDVSLHHTTMPYRIYIGTSARLLSPKSKTRF